MSLFPARRHTRELEAAVVELGLVVEVGEEGIAVFGPAGIDDPHRYLVTRELGGPGPVVGYCLINPSVADHRRPDATLRRCVGFAAAMEASCVMVCNPFAFRAQRIRDLPGAADPVGPRNDEVLAVVACQVDVMIAGWGAPTKIPLRLRPRLDHVEQLLRAAGEVHALKVLPDGSPGHPLMLRSSCSARPWTRAA